MSAVCPGLSDLTDAVLHCLQENQTPNILQYRCSMTSISTWTIHSPWHWNLLCSIFCSTYIPLTNYVNWFYLQSVFTKKKSVFKTLWPSLLYTMQHSYSLLYTKLDGVGHDTKHMTRDMWHLTHDRWGGVNFLSKCQLSSSYSLGVKIILQRITDWVNEWMSDRGVCRTGLATPGLLTMLYNTIFSTP